MLSTTSSLSSHMVGFTRSTVQLTLAPENGQTLTRMLGPTFFMTIYPFSFLTVLSPKTYTVLFFPLVHRFHFF